MMAEIDTMQNEELKALRKRLDTLSRDHSKLREEFSALLAEIKSIQNIGRGLIGGFGLLVGIDTMTYMEV